MTFASLIPEWIPNIHPLLVHFPIALFFFAVAMDFLSFFVPKKWWNETMTAIVYIAGLLSTIVVFVTGNMAAGSLHPGSPTVKHAIDAHQAWALRALWFLLFILLYGCFFS